MMFSFTLINSPLDDVEFAVYVSGSELFSETLGLITDSLYSDSIRFTNAGDCF